MSADSPARRAVGRTLVVVFAVTVVALRLGAAGCGSTGVAPTRNAPPRVMDPAYLPATKAGGGFFPAPYVQPADARPAPPTSEPQQQAPRPR